MPSKKRVPIGTARPIVEAALPGRRADREISPPGVGKVYIGSEDPIVDVVARLTGPVRCTPPRPRYQTDERHGRTSITRYVGQEPIEQELPIKFDGQGDSVMARIRDLERLAEPAAGGEPPVVRALGPSVRHEGLRWRVTRITEDTARAKYADGGGQQIFYAATVTLTQRVRDQLLNFTGDNAQGIRNRTDRVRDGESSLYQVAKRIYGDRSRANDIARANPGLRLGHKLKPGTRLRIP